jgi:hypothetical protein
MRWFAAICLVAAAAALFGIAVTGVPAFRIALASLDAGGIGHGPRALAAPSLLHAVNATLPAAEAGRRPDGRTVPAPPPVSNLPPSDATDVIRNMLALEEKQVPLPEGEWQLFGSAVSPGKSDNQRLAGPVVSMVLLRLHENTANAAILIQTNKADAGAAAWGRPTGCERTDFYAARIRYASDHDGSCSYVAFVNAMPQSSVAVDPAWRDTVRQAATMGVRLPAHWLVAAYRVTDPRDALQVRYYFPSPTTGPVPRDQIESLVAWSNLAWTSVGSGFRNRLTLREDTGVPDWPLRDAATAQKTAPARAAIGGDEVLNVGHAGLKTVTYRIFGSMTDFGVNYFYLGSAAAPVVRLANFFDLVGPAVLGVRIKGDATTVLVLLGITRPNGD